MEEEVKLPIKEETIPKKIVQTFYVAFSRLPNSEWMALSLCTQYDKKFAVLDIENAKKYGTEDTEYKLISFDIETEI